MKLRKSIKIGRYQLLYVDWFEISNFLSMISGLNIAGLATGIILIQKDFMRVPSLIFTLLNFASFLVLSQIVKKLRDLNPDRELEVKINGDD